MSLRLSSAALLEVRELGHEICGALPCEIRPGRIMADVIETVTGRALGGLLLVGFPQIRASYITGVPWGVKFAPTADYDDIDDGGFSES